MAAEFAKKLFEGGPAPPEGGKTIAYGTAGFRTKAELLDHVSYRVGVLAALRSACVGQAVGVMVTASHNPEPDNGSKIVDPDGGMLAAAWEGYASSLANAASPAEIEATLRQIFKKRDASGDEEGVPPTASSPGSIRVLLGQDTRKSSPHLTSLVAKGVAAAGGVVQDLGLCTTPQVHWAVLQVNAGGVASMDAAAMELYFKAHAQSLKALLHPNKPALLPLTVDCGNGIGAASIKAIIPHLKAEGVELELCVINGGEGGLNAGCGAEHVQKTRGLPAGVEGKEAEAAGRLYASFDGDADRVVLFACAASEPGGLLLLDGDKILALLCGWIAKTLKEASLDLSIGIVQTAYANGASTKHIKEKVLGEEGVRGELAMVATGVKHLHHKALDFDVGAYFEANGHGTVIFSSSARAKIKAAASAGEAPLAAKRMQAFSELINPAVGDALSDMLAVHAVLSLEGLTFAQWGALYQDLPSTMTKVMVKDRSLIKTTADEQHVTSPPELQPLVDAAVATVAGSRSFVRPSGTEDCVRVYAEAPTLQEAQDLAAKVGAEVTKLLG